MNKPLNIFAIFPGQGSQSVGMGLHLYNKYDTAKKLFDTADGVLGFKISEICFNGPEERLTDTSIAQPAILIVSTICNMLCREQYGDILAPTGAAGHSLGEYSALVAAGSLDFEQAVRLVNRRGMYMQSTSGKMIAVLGKSVEEIEHALKGQVEGTAEIANINAPGQVVVAGDDKGIEEAKSLLKGSRVIELKVSAPFHCSLMKEAEVKLARDIDGIDFKPARFPVYANYSGSAVSSPEEIKSSLIKQVCSRVKWVDCVHAFKREHQDTSLAIEFGNGSVLTGLMKRIDPAFKTVTCDSPDNLEPLFASQT